MNCPKCNKEVFVRPDDGRAVVFQCGSSQFTSLDGEVAFTASKQCKINEMQILLKDLYYNGDLPGGGCWENLKNWLEKENLI